MIEIEYLPIVLTGIGIIVSILYYASVLRNANKTQQMQLETRQASFFIQIYNKILDKEFLGTWLQVINYDWTSSDSIQLIYDFDVNPEMSTNIALVAQWYEGLGVLVQEKLLDIHLIAVMFPSTVINGWNAMGPWIKSRQEIDPAAGIKFEYLYLELMKYLDEHPEIKTI